MLHESGSALFGRGVKMCLDSGLNVIIDLRKTLGFSFDFGEKESGFFDNEKLRQRFCRLWKTIVAKYGNMTERIAFELLNEITDMEFIGRWNEISYECIRRIRKFAPDAVLLVGSYWNNSVSAVKDLAAPYDDKVIYNFHCYDPMLFTHQGATRTPMIDPKKRMTYAESGCSADYFIKLFESAARTAGKNNAILYCGEYGVIDRATPADTLRWHKDINAAFNRYGISHAAWSYKEMDFGLSEKRLEGVIDELVKYL